MKTRPAHELLLVRYRQLIQGYRLAEVPADGPELLRFIERALVACAIDDIRALQDRKIAENLGAFPIGREWRARSLRLLDRVQRGRRYHSWLIGQESIQREVA